MHESRGLHNVRLSAHVCHVRLDATQSKRHVGLDAMEPKHYVRFIKYILNNYYHAVIFLKEKLSLFKGACGHSQELAVIEDNV